MPRLHVYKNEKETFHAFAVWLADLVNEKFTEQEDFTIALLGEGTPKLLYKTIASEVGELIDWNKVQIFQGEEKFVVMPGEKNNSGLSFKLMVSAHPVPESHIHFIQTDIAPAESATQYEELLHKHFPSHQKTFDLVIVGTDEQGNILSLLSGNENANDNNALVVPIYDKQEDLFKITLTISAINSARIKAFLLTGKRKEDVVQQVLKGKYDPEKYPAQLIQTANKSVHWFLDEAAAGKLIKPIS